MKKQILLSLMLLLATASFGITLNPKANGVVNLRKRSRFQPHLPPGLPLSLFRHKSNGQSNAKRRILPDSALRPKRKES